MRISLIKKITYLIFFSLSILFNAQNSSLLLEKNGFRNIKLGDNVNNYPFIYKYDELSSAYNKIIDGKSYTFNMNSSHVVNLEEAKYDKLGNAKILGIYIGTIDDKIFQINVITNYNFSIYQNFINLFGDPLDYSHGKHKDTYSLWRYKNIDLTISANNLMQDQATYYSIEFSNTDLEKKYLEEMKINRERKKKLELNEFKDQL